MWFHWKIPVVWWFDWGGYAIPKPLWFLKEHIQFRVVITLSVLLFIYNDWPHGQIISYGRDQGVLCVCIYLYSASTQKPLSHLWTYSALRKYSAPLNFATFCHISGFKHKDIKLYFFVKNQLVGHNHEVERHLLDISNFFNKSKTEELGVQNYSAPLS